MKYFAGDISPSGDRTLSGICCSTQYAEKTHIVSASFSVVIVENAPAFKNGQWAS